MKGGALVKATCCSRMEHYCRPRHSKCPKCGTLQRQDQILQVPFTATLNVMGGSVSMVLHLVIKLTITKSKAAMLLAKNSPRDQKRSHQDLPPEDSQKSALSPPLWTWPAGGGRFATLLQH
jgi:hypothetical protein